MSSITPIGRWHRLLPLDREQYNLVRLDIRRGQRNRIPDSRLKVHVDGHEALLKIKVCRHWRDESIDARALAVRCIETVPTHRVRFVKVSSLPCSPYLPNEALWCIRKVLTIGRSAQTPVSQSDSARALIFDIPMKLPDAPLVSSPTYDSLQKGRK